MSGDLVREVMKALDEPGPLEGVARILETHLSADRISISTLSGTDFQVRVARGHPLLPAGASMTSDMSTHFLASSYGEAFRSRSFDTDHHFTRPIDRICLSHGFQSGVSVPLSGATDPVGSLCVSSLERGWDVTGFLESQLHFAAALIGRHIERQDLGELHHVLVVHPDPLVVHALREFLDQPGIRAHFVTSEAMMADVPAEPCPDVVVVGGGTWAAADTLTAALNGADVPSVYLSPRDAPAERTLAELIGATGFLTHAQAPDTLGPLIEMLATGRHLPQQHRVLASPRRRRHRLTPRETQLLIGLDNGDSFRQIAASMTISETTLKSYARDLYAKLEVHSRGEAVRYAREAGLL